MSATLDTMILQNLIGDLVGFVSCSIYQDELANRFLQGPILQHIVLVSLMPAFVDFLQRTAWLGNNHLIMGPSKNTLAC